MQFRALLLAAVACFTTAQAKVNWINHDQVHPFAQVEAANASEKAAIKFKPQLQISYGCHPYPAVQADGAVSDGLKWGGKPDGKYQGSGLGSQVYSARPGTRYERREQVSAIATCGWLYMVIWIDNPEAINPAILGVCVRTEGGNEQRVPPDAKFLDGSSLKLDYYKRTWHRKTGLQLTKDKGEFQDLVTWEQMTEEARITLTEADFDDHWQERNDLDVPFIDGEFTVNLEKAWVS
ncbi:necrosis inducing-like protein NPP1 type [Phytophthora sojae]|uniref:Necrosis inducing-like protein NPP1 type n=1 Tax=Phytophthora sojae (strain P6497) TaxID=1094619 RepID=G5A8S5_PHYSP|nr:necrosis inducing-like protein NPP1 type [Phytophthora sojae]EGZ08301.1 necrosis inducing-like protein NPP1 type [Phytophthora sojae]|eukprot:XP_009536473.1 necrosis inducing-like protein NPP1 type [Phytophthora sojae]